MTGLVLALLYAALMHFVGGKEFGFVYENATGFLHTWYIWTSVILGVLAALIWFLGVLGVSSRLGLLAGGIVGGITSVVLAIGFIIHRGALIFGSLLMSQAYVGGAWDNTKLIWGGILLLIGLITGGSSSSSSSN